ncbi:DUF1559 domain-containing protein [Aeoliella sp.]|uniref:DUF1559 family PulG-like putative transporter n=1 Tax=Aeoliella sp. TaxID=2795800 RepID=UPI003CCC0F69
MRSKSSKAPRTPSARGFTLVELLVVIAIIGILVALLLPAVQAAREAARRTACVNNLKNLGLAALTYHDTHKHFPVNYGAAWGDESPKDRPAVGWLLDMLPQLEQQPLYDRFKQGGAYEGSFRADKAKFVAPNIGIISTKNGISCPELLSTELAILACPSDNDNEKVKTNQFQFTDWPVSVTNYKGVLGDTFLGQTFGGTYVNTAPPSGLYPKPPPANLGNQWENDCHADTRCRGFFFRNSYLRPVKISTVTDGTSHSFMIGEDLPAYNRHSTAFYANGSWCSCNIPLNNLINLEPETLNLEYWWDQQGFRSLHPGGANFCRADGSVEFITDSISHTAYRAHCTRNGDELVAGTL